MPGDRCEWCGLPNGARKQAEIVAAVPDVPSAELWRDIADAIKRL